MRSKIRWHYKARLDVQRQGRWLRRNAGLNVQTRFREVLLESLQRLAEFPLLGHEFKDFPEAAPARLWQIPGFGEYIIVYEPLSEGILFVRLLHAKQDFLRVLNGKFSFDTRP